MNYGLIGYDQWICVDGELGSWLIMGCLMLNCGEHMAMCSIMG